MYSIEASNLAHFLAYSMELDVQSFLGELQIIRPSLAYPFYSRQVLGAQSVLVLWLWAYSFECGEEKRSNEKIEHGDCKRIEVN